MRSPNRSPSIRLAATLGGAAIALGNSSCTSGTEAARAAPPPPRSAGVEAAPERELSDADISRAVKRELAVTPSVEIDRMGVETTEGVVHLIGEVGNLLAKDRAQRIAETVKGVRAVANRLEVRVPDRPDAEITRDVAEVLRLSSAIDASKIDVDVAGGAVRLAGRVAAPTDRELATAAVKSVRGVREVDDALRVDEDAPRSDDAIAADVEQRLRWDALVDDARVDVGVEDGVATLRGAVGSAAERTRAIRDARIAGAREVDAEGLRVVWWASRDDRRARRREAPSDDQIQDAIEVALRYDPRVRDADVQADVRSGVATLEGRVATLVGKNAAEQLALHTVGVAEVDNRLTVRPGPDLDDQALAERIRARLAADPVAEQNDIRVAVRGGAAELSGEVGSFFEKAQVEGLASTIPGVVDVDNLVTVSSPRMTFYSDPFLYDVEPYVLVGGAQYVPDATSLSDRRIRARIVDELAWSPFVDREAIEVDVLDGVATLTGEVDSFRERTVATENAFQGGAVSVRNDLLVVDPDVQP